MTGQGACAAIEAMDRSPQVNNSLPSIGSVGFGEAFHINRGSPPVHPQPATAPAAATERAARLSARHTYARLNSLSPALMISVPVLLSTMNPGVTRYEK